ncbi:MAG: polysaccharide biosynthesis tyrosine autokinase [Elusimicrobiales bacterium]|nr:polysaccharide biosynthesis tyrosine autokinase [Elusimicrobiales bacterium]
MNGEGLSLYDYWRILNRRKYAFIFVFVTSVIASYVYTKLSPYVYSSQAVIKIQPPKIYTQIPGSDIMDIDPWGAVSTEIKVISSLEVAKKAAIKLKLVDFQNSDVDIIKAASLIVSSYKVERVADTNLISITAYASNPYKAYDIVSAIIDAYKEYDLEQKSTQAKKTFNDILQRKIEIEDKLRSLERQKKEYIQKNPTSGTGGLITDQIAEFEIKRKELLEKYTLSHPDVILIDKKIEALNKRLKELPSQELELLRINREIKLQEELYTTITKQYEEAKLGLSSIVSFITIINPPVVNTNPVLPNTKLNVSIGVLIGLFLGFIIVFILENLDVSITTIEEIEDFIKSPVVGIIPYISSSNMKDNWFTSLFRKERFSIEGFRTALIFNRSSQGNIIESYHTLRTNIFASLAKKPPISIVVSSSGAAEGKTLTALNLSFAAALSGLRTLFIEADLRRPIVHEVFNINRIGGLSEILSGKITIDEAIKDVGDFIYGLGSSFVSKFAGIDNIKIITSGIQPYNIIDLLNNANWKDLIEELKSRFDLIIFDGPPVLLFVDSIIIAHHTDGVLMIYKAGKIARGALKRAKEQLTSAGTKMIGICLNGIRATDFGPRYSYYGDYKDYKS